MLVVCTMLLKSFNKGLEQAGLWYCTWLQSSSYPAYDVVDSGYLVVSVDVHTHLPETDKNKEGVIHTGEKDEQRNRGEADQ